MSREVCGICWCPYDEETGECACAPESSDPSGTWTGGKMNREDIIRMAREAGLPYMYQTGEVANLGLVERFAALVAAAEREACAQLVDSLVASGPVAEVQQRHNWAYMNARDSIRERGADMTRDDIIRMAREAGLEDGWAGWCQECGCDSDKLTRFAHLVYEATFRDANLAASRTILDAAILAEREACAKVCEELDKKSADGEWGDYLAGWSDGTDDCAAAIRARKG